MPSSTSSSSQRLPRLRWRAVLIGGLAIFAAFVGVMELRLAARGFRPSVVDSASLWGVQRARADALGAHALILVGASRMLLDVDVATLRRHTGMEPVQLAVDGSSFVPVLQGLAADPNIDGTVLVDLAENVLALPPKYDAAYAYEEAFERDGRAAALPDFNSTEADLSDLLHAHLRSYADGTRPLTALVARILPARPTRQYLRTLPDREIEADYAQAPMPDMYYFRVMRNLGETLPMAGVSYGQLDVELMHKIDALQPLDNTLFLQSLPTMRGLVDAIRSHGGRVLFALLPTSGDVRAIDDKRFPRELFWDRFVAAVPAPAVNFEDVPALRHFFCPDGSHLDYHDRGRFTAALIAALPLGQPATSGEPAATE